MQAVARVCVCVCGSGGIAVSSVFMNYYSLFIAL